MSAGSGAAEQQVSSPCHPPGGTAYPARLSCVVRSAPASPQPRDACGAVAQLGRGPGTRLGIADRLALGGSCTASARRSLCGSPAPAQSRGAGLWAVLGGREEQSWAQRAQPQTPGEQPGGVGLLRNSQATAVSLGKPTCTRRHAPGTRYSDSQSKNALLCRGVPGPGPQVRSGPQPGPARWSLRWLGVSGPPVERAGGRDLRRRASGPRALRHRGSPSPNAGGVE